MSTTGAIRAASVSMGTLGVGLLLGAWFDVDPIGALMWALVAVLVAIPAYVLAPSIARKLWHSSIFRWEPGRVASGLDQVSRYVVESGWGVSLMAEANQDPAARYRPLAISEGKGRYGPYDFTEVRAAYAKLQELGVIEYSGADEIGPTYRWTDFGRVVAKVVVERGERVTER